MWKSSEKLCDNGFENNFRDFIYSVYFRISFKTIVSADLKSLLFTSLQGDIPFLCSLFPCQLLTFTWAPTVLVKHSYVSAKSSRILLSCEQTPFRYQGRCGSHPARHKITFLPSSWLLLKFSQGISMSNKTTCLWPNTAFRLLFSSLSSNKLILSHLPRPLILETSSSYFSNPFIFKRQLPHSNQRAFPDLSGAPSLPLSTTWLLVLLCWHEGMEHNQTSAVSHPALPLLQCSARLGTATTYPTAAATIPSCSLQPQLFHPAN